MFVASLWTCVTWLIWKNRNETVYCDDKPDLGLIVEEVKARLWSWISVKAPEFFKGSFGDWLRNPLS